MKPAENMNDVDRSDWIFFYSAALCRLLFLIRHALPSFFDPSFGDDFPCENKKNPTSSRRFIRGPDFLLFCSILFLIIVSLDAGNLCECQNLSLKTEKGGYTDEWVDNAVAWRICSKQVV